MISSRRAVVWGLAVAGGAALAGATGELAAQGPSELPPARVVVSPVVERTVASGRSFTGTVVARRRSVVGSAVDGRLVEVMLEAGDRVLQAEQPLARLRTETLEIELAAARAELELRRQEHAELRRTLPEQAAQAAAQLAASEARKEYAQSNFARMTRLTRQSGGVTEEELALSRSAALAAEQDVLVARAELRLVEPGEEHERVRQAAARALSAAEEVRRLEDRLEKHTLRAPFPGFVTAKHVEIGDWIKQGDPAFEVVELDPIEIEVSVPEEHVSSIRVGTSARVQLDALGPAALADAEAVVARIVPQADLRSRTFPVRVRMPNADLRLKAGMLARVMLPVGEPQTVTLVPKDALVLGGPEPEVVVVDSQGTSLRARAVRVRLGVAEGSWIQVTGDVQPGERVVVRGNERLRPMQPLLVAEERGAEFPAAAVGGS